MNNTTSLGYMKKRIYEFSNKSITAHDLFQTLIMHNMNKMLSDGLIEKLSIPPYTYDNIKVKKDILNEFFITENHNFVDNFIDILYVDMKVKKRNINIIEKCIVKIINDTKEDKRFLTINHNQESHNVYL